MLVQAFRRCERSETLTPLLLLNQLKILDDLTNTDAIADEDFLLGND